MNNTDNTDGRKVDWSAVKMGDLIRNVSDEATDIEPGKLYRFIRVEGGSVWLHDDVGDARMRDVNNYHPAQSTIRNVATPQQAEPIWWGETIKGDRPEWLTGDDIAWVKWAIGGWSSHSEGSPVRHMQHTAWESFRLPHDHPHYATQHATPAVPQEVVERMVKLCKTMSIAVPEEVKIMGTGQQQAYTEARAIVAMLEPVDEVLVACREICGVALGSFMFRDGERDDSPEMVCALAAYRRALAKGAGE